MKVDGAPTKNTPGPRIIGENPYLKNILTTDKDHN